MAFEDETWLELKPLIRATWMEKGSQRKVLTPGINRRLVAFITLLYPVKAIKYNIFQTKNTALFKRHVRELLRLIHGKGFRRLILVVDNATYHRSRAAKRFIEERRDELKVFYLPTYAPDLNEVDGRINKPLKADICSNHPYKSLEELSQDTTKYLRMLNNRWRKKVDLT